MAYRFGVSLPIASRSSLAFANSGAVDGDFLFAAIQVNSTTAITPPAGWTLREDTPVNGTTSHVSVYWKVAAGEPGTWTFTLAAAQTCQGFVGVWPGQDTGATPVDVSSENQAPPNSASLVAPGVTTTQANDLVIAAWFWNGNRTVSASPGDMTIRHQVTGGPGLVIADGVQAAAGSTGTKTLTIASVTSWGAQLLAVKPAGGTPATGTVTGSGITTAGGAVTATAGTGATGVITGGAPVLTLNGGPLMLDGSALTLGTDGASQTIPVTGSLVTGTAGAGGVDATGTVAGGSIPTVGNLVTGTAGASDAATITGETILVTGQTVTGSAGTVINASATVTGDTVPITGSLVAGTFDNTVTGVVAEDAVPVSGGIVTATAAITATGIVSGDTIPITGGAIITLIGGAVQGTVTGGSVAVSGALIQAVDDLTFYGEFTGRAALVAAFTGDATFND